jgi:hypothetical protein
MTAVKVLKAAKSVGVTVRLDGSNLAISSRVKPPLELVAALKLHKAEIIELLQRHNAPDWRTIYDKRVAHLTQQRGLTGEVASLRAFEYCVGKWLVRNPERSDANLCIACQGDNWIGRPLLPFGVIPSRLVWLHSECWPGWYRGRRSGAVAALVGSGIDAPLNYQSDFEKTRN